MNPERMEKWYAAVIAGKSWYQIDEDSEATLTGSNTGVLSAR